MHGHRRNKLELVLRFFFIEPSTV
uniref:Uncharacterized protein n=1 Tax=Anguilla anguilla TaxID=7936 RepID=A0A0E9WDI2_ANGAN